MKEFYKFLRQELVIPGFQIFKTVFFFMLMICGMLFGVALLPDHLVDWFGNTWGFILSILYVIIYWVLYIILIAFIYYKWEKRRKKKEKAS